MLLIWNLYDRLATGYSGIILSCRCKVQIIRWCNLSIGATYADVRFLHCHKNSLFYIMCNIHFWTQPRLHVWKGYYTLEYHSDSLCVILAHFILRATFSTNQRHVVRRFYWDLNIFLVRSSVLIYQSRTHTILHFGATLTLRVATTNKLYIILPRAYIAYQRVAERPLRSYCSAVTW